MSTRLGTFRAMVPVHPDHLPAPRRPADVAQTGGVPRAGQGRGDGAGKGGTGGAQGAAFPGDEGKGGVEGGFLRREDGTDAREADLAGEGTTGLQALMEALAQASTITQVAEAIVAHLDGATPGGQLASRRESRARWRSSRARRRPTRRPLDDLEARYPRTAACSARRRSFQ